MHFRWFFGGPWYMWDHSSLTRDQIYTPCIERQSFNHRTAKEVPNFTHFKVYSLRILFIVWDSVTILQSRCRTFLHPPKLLHAHFCPWHLVAGNDWFDFCHCSFTFSIFSYKLDHTLCSLPLWLLSFSINFLGPTPGNAGLDTVILFVAL